MKPGRIKIKSIAIVIFLVVVLVVPFATALYLNQRVQESMNIQGTVDALFYENFETNDYQEKYFMNTDQGKKEIILQENPHFISGQRIAIHGSAQQNRILVQSYEILSEKVSGENQNLGEQRTAVILYNSEENPTEAITAKEAWQLVFGEKNSINEYVKEVSYNKAFLAGDVFGWYTLPVTEQQLCAQSAQLAISAADPDAYFPNYSRVILVHPLLQECYAGIGSVGIIMNPFQTNDGNTAFSYSIINGAISIYENGAGIHELGHGFEIRHANDWECGDETNTGTCQSINYGDHFDVMGKTSRKGHFNAIHKNIIGWFDSGNSIEAMTHGRYVIEPIEIISNEAKAVKIPNTFYDYYIEFRRAIGHDAINVGFEGEEIYNGAMIHINVKQEFGDTQLLDISPHTGGSQYQDSIDVILRQRETFYDLNSDASITTTKISEEELEVYFCSAEGITQYGDINTDGNVDSSDINCMIEGFRGDFTSCDFENIDIAPCNGDRIIDVHDMLALLDALQGKPACSAQCA